MRPFFPLEDDYWYNTTEYIIIDEEFLEFCRKDLGIDLEPYNWEALPYVGGEYVIAEHLLLDPFFIKYEHLQD